MIRGLLQKRKHAVAHYADAVSEPDAENRQRENAVAAVTVEQKARVTRMPAQPEDKAPHDDRPRFFHARGYVLETGRVVLEDSAHALLENDDVKKAYLGE